MKQMIKIQNRNVCKLVHKFAELRGIVETLVVSPHREYFRANLHLSCFLEKYVHEMYRIQNSVFDSIYLIFAGKADFITLYPPSCLDYRTFQTRSAGSFNKTIDLFRISYIDNWG